MSRRRSARPLLAGGIVLLVLAGVLGFPRLAVYVDTQLYTRRIPTAPVLLSVEVQSTQPAALLPAMDSDGSSPTMGPPTTSTPPAPVEGLADVSVTTPSPMRPPAISTTPTAMWSGTAPISLSIPSIGLEAPIAAIGLTLTTVGGQSQAIWDVPDGRLVGWHSTSVPLGIPGNTVLNGHNASRGEVFRDLYRVQEGAQIFVEGESGEVYVYRVEEKYILREAGQALSVRLENARYIQETLDERLTLVTCHPYGSLANRLVIVAFPVSGRVSGRGGAN
jgi:LPXTG-site transpeptidase (sortase) family protein